MPNFADLLVKRLQNAYPNAAMALLGRYGISPDVRNTIRTIIEKNWNDLPLSDPNSSTIGSDGSMMQYNLRDGSRLLFTRAIAMSAGEEVREMDLGIIFGQKQEIVFFQAHLSQLLEICATRKLIEKEKPDYALIDGSLMTFLSNLPIEIKVRSLSQHSPLNFQSFSSPPSGLAISLTKEIIKLIKTARENKTILIGISKDSNTSYLQKLLLDPMNISFLQNFAISSSNLSKLLGEYNGILKDPMSVISEFTKFGQIKNLESDPDWQKLLEMLSFRIFAPCDTAMLNYMVPTSGYSVPIKLTASVDQKKVIDLWQRSPTQFLNRNFKRTMGFIPVDLRTDFYNAVKTAISGMENFEAVITTYVRFEEEALPIRLDILASDAGFKSEKFFKVNEPQFVEITPQIKKAVAVAHAGYVSNQIHNALLWKADDTVKMKRGETGVIYLDIIENETYLSRFEFLSRREIRDLM